MVPGAALSLVLGAGHRLGAGVGMLAEYGRLLRMGAIAARYVVPVRRGTRVGRHPYFDACSGLSWSWYTLLERRHFRDRDWNRFAVSRDRSKQVYNHSTFVRQSLAAHGHRIVNVGTPVAVGEQ